MSTNPLNKRQQADMERFRRITAVQREKAARNEGGQPGNTNTLKHGIYANRFMSEEEMALFDTLIERLRKDFSFNDSSDFIQLELVGLNFIKLQRAEEAGDIDTVHKIDQMLRNHLKDLKVTKISREGDAPRGPETTPAEWASALLQRWHESQKPKRSRKRKKDDVSIGNKE